MARSPQRDPDSFRSRPYGSSAILSVTIVGVVMVILVLGSIFIFRGLGSDDDEPTVIPSPSGTSELVSGIPTATREDTTTPPDETPSSTGAPSETATGVSPTPSPDTDTATSTEEPNPSPTEEPAATDEPEPTETDAPAPEPTATDVPEAEPTELPFEGDFGFLPPAQLPSGGVSTTLTLEYQLGMSLESLPDEGTVYRITWPVYSLEDVELARDRLALQASVVEEGVGVYRVESDRGTLFVSPTEIIFRAAGFGEGGSLPGDEEAIGIAREWIDLSAFISGDMNGGAIVGRDEDLERVVVKFRPVSPLPNLAPNPSATVTIGPGGVVLEVRIAWPASLEASDYGYSDALDVWREVQAGQGFLEADISSVLATGQLTGTATISDYSTAYTMAGNPSVGQYLVPVITFEGTARIDQTGDEIPVYVSIPVVYHEEGTAG